MNFNLVCNNNSTWSDMRNFTKRNKTKQKEAKKNVYVFINPKSNVGIIITATTDHLHM